MLVLEGPSGLANTQFSMSLAPRSAEVTCSNCDYPDLREFKVGRCDLVLLGKAKNMRAFTSNKTMQAGPARASLSPNL